MVTSLVENRKIDFSTKIYKILYFFWLIMSDKIVKIALVEGSDRGQK